MLCHGALFAALVVVAFHGPTVVVSGAERMTEVPLLGSDTSATDAPVMTRATMRQPTVRRSVDGSWPDARYSPFDYDAFLRYKVFGSVSKTARDPRKFFGKPLKVSKGIDPYTRVEREDLAAYESEVRYDQDYIHLTGEQDAQYKKEWLVGLVNLYNSHVTYDTLRISCPQGDVRGSKKTKKFVVYSCDVSIHSCDKQAALILSNVFKFQAEPETMLSMSTSQRRSPFSSVTSSLKPKERASKYASEMLRSTKERHRDTRVTADEVTTYGEIPKPKFSKWSDEYKYRYVTDGGPVSYAEEREVEDLLAHREDSPEAYKAVEESCPLLLHTDDPGFGRYHWHVSFEKDTLQFIAKILKLEKVGKTYSSERAGALSDLGFISGKLLDRVVPDVKDQKEVRALAKLTASGHNMLPVRDKPWIDGYLKDKFTNDHAPETVFKRCGDYANWIEKVIIKYLFGNRQSIFRLIQENKINLHALIALEFALPVPSLIVRQALGLLRDTAYHLEADDFLVPIQELRNTASKTQKSSNGEYGRLDNVDDLDETLTPDLLPDTVPVEDLPTDDERPTLSTPTRSTNAGLLSNAWEELLGELEDDLLKRMNS